MTLGLRIGARSDVGLVREHNEDSLYAGHRLLAVADGIGGAVAGEVASSITIAALRDLDNAAPAVDVLGALREAVHQANAALGQRIREQPELAGMGTTLTAMLWQNERLGLAHVGDSRGYLRRDGNVHQITRDQTFVQMLIDDGRITPEQAATHPQRSVILNALDGRDDDVEPDLTMREPLAGDRYLLCSDGLSDYVEAHLVVDALADQDPQRTCNRLVELALDAGAPDNVTVIIADVVDETAASPDQHDTVAIGLDTRLPIVAGAVADPSLLTRQQDDEPSTGTETNDQPPRRHSLGRRLAIVVAVVVLLVAGAIVGTGIAIHHRWYVAADHRTSTVAVYQGVSGTALGYHLSHVKTTTDLPLSALTQPDSDRLASDITSSSQSDANDIVATLRQDSCAAAQAQAAAKITKRHKSQPAPLPTWCSS